MSYMMHMVLFWTGVAAWVAFLAHIFIIGDGMGAYGKWWRTRLGLCVHEYVRYRRVISLWRTRCKHCGREGGLA